MNILRRIIRWLRGRGNAEAQQTTSYSVQAEDASATTDANHTNYYHSGCSSATDSPTTCVIQKPNNSRAEAIMRVCRERGVEELVHFTSIRNLRTIVEYGLLSLDDLERMEIKYDYNDENRLEGMRNAICLSVSFPNYKMFYKYRQFKGYTFVIISISKSILWELSCIFCPTNAAQKYISMLLRDPQSMMILSEPEAFEDMFSEKLCRIKTGGYVGIPQRLLEKGRIREYFLRERLLEESRIDEYLQRANLGIPPHYTTDPQAEVLCLESIPNKYIRKIYVENEKAKFDLVSHYPDLPIAIEVKNEFFRPRVDYMHWRNPYGV